MSQVHSMDHNEENMTSQEGSSDDFRPIRRTHKLRSHHEARSHYAERAVTAHPYNHPIGIPRRAHDYYSANYHDEQLVSNPFDPHGPPMRLKDVKRKCYYRQFYAPHPLHSHAYKYPSGRHRNQVDPRHFMPMAMSDTNQSRILQVSLQSSQNSGLITRQNRMTKNQQGQSSSGFTNFVEIRNSVPANCIIEGNGQMQDPIKQKKMCPEKPCFHTKQAQDKIDVKNHNYVLPMQESLEMKKMYYQAQQDEPNIAENFNQNVPFMQEQPMEMKKMYYQAQQDEPNIAENFNQNVPFMQEQHMEMKQMYNQAQQDEPNIAENFNPNISFMQEQPMETKKMYNQAQHVDHLKNNELFYPQMAPNESNSYACSTANDENVQFSDMQFIQTSHPVLLNEKNPLEQNKELLFTNSSGSSFSLEEVPCQNDPDHSTLTSFLERFQKDLESDEVNTVVAQNKKEGENCTANGYEFSSHDILSKTAEMEMEDAVRSITIMEGTDNVINISESNDDLYLQYFDELGKNAVVEIIPPTSELFQNLKQDMNTEGVTSTSNLELTNSVLKTDHKEDQSIVLKSNSEEMLVDINVPVKTDETDNGAKVEFYANLNDFVQEETVRSSHNDFETTSMDNFLSESEPSCSKQEKATNQQLAVPSKMNKLSTDTASLDSNNSKNQKPRSLKNPNKTAVSSVSKNKNVAKHKEGLKWKNRFLWKSKKMPRVTLQKFYLDKLITACLKKGINNKVVKRILKSVFCKMGVNLLSSISDLSCDLKTLCKKKRKDI